MWTAANEGAKFWLRVMNELQARGVRDVLIAVVDGLKGFPEAIETVFPEVTVQTCIVHLIRYSLAHASWKTRKDLASALRPIYQAATEEEAGAALDEFERVRGVGSSRRSFGVGGGTGRRSSRSSRSRRRSAGDLHDERDREPEQHGAAGGADAGAFPERPSGGKADLPDAAEGGAEVEPATDILVPGARRVRDPVRRPVPGGGGVRRVRPVAGTGPAARLSRVGAGRVPPILLAASGRIFSQNLGSWPSVPHRTGPLPDRSRRTRAPGGSCAGVEIALDAPPAFAVRSQVSGEWPRQSGRRSAWRGSPVALLAPLPALPPPAPRRPKLLRTGRFRPSRQPQNGSPPRAPDPGRYFRTPIDRFLTVRGEPLKCLATDASFSTPTLPYTEFLTLAVTRASPGHVSRCCSLCARRVACSQLNLPTRSFGGE